MNNIQPFNYVGHWTGTGTTSGAAVSITGPTYTRSIVDSSSGTTSRFQWRPSTQTAAPDKRVLRPRNRMSVAYLITVRPTTATWQTRLTRIEIAGNPWVRPDHVHCVASAASAISDNSSGWGDFDLQVNDPSGNAIPNALVVQRRRQYTHAFTATLPHTLHPWWTNYGSRGFFSWTQTSDSSIMVRANSSGVAASVMTNSLPGTREPYTSQNQQAGTMILWDYFDTVTVYDPLAVWIGNVDNVAHPSGGAPTLAYLTASPPVQTFPGAQSLAIIGYHPTRTITSAITTNIWPQDTFTSWGIAHIGANTDWCPPIIVEASDTVDFEASMSMWIFDRPRFPFGGTHLRSISESGQQSLNNLPISPPAPAAPPFAFSRHRVLPAGQYWRTPTYPATYASPTARWVAIPGSSSTGFTPPITEPTCPFVITPGVPD